MALTIVLNGERRSFGTLEDGAALSRLVAEMGLKSDRVAIEVDGAIVSRGLWPGCLLADGAKVEIVHFVGGGSAAA